MSLSPPSSPAFFTDSCLTIFNDNDLTDMLFEPPAFQIVDITEKPRGTPRVRHYIRQKNEIAELEQQVANLSKILQREQTTKNMKNDLESEPSVVDSEWQMLARHNLDVRLAAEAQRRWLQAAIMGKVELVGDLKKVVRQHLKIAALIAAHSEGQKCELFLEPTDELLYAMDMQDIDELYQQTDVVFGTCELSTEVKYLQRTVSIDNNEVSVKFGREQRLMFSYEETCRSIWMLSNHVHRQFDREEFKGFRDPETTHATKYRIACSLHQGGFASLKTRIITRRFLEKDRMILVWKSVIAGEGPLCGIQTDESGWVIVQPSPTGSGTTMQVCVKQVPLHLNCPTGQAAAQQFDELLQSVVQKNSHEITTGAEALLLEDAVTEIDVIARKRKRARRAKQLSR